MNEDKMIVMLSNLDDDLIEKEIDNLMDGVECDMESINRKANQKLEKYNRKMKFRKILPYAAAVCLCFICINTVYADEISQALRSFFNKTPVYSTMVDGGAYYLKGSLVLDDNLAIDSFMVSEGRLDMELASKLGIEVLDDMKIIPKDVPDAQYVMGGYSEDGNNKYFFSFMNGKENNNNIKPFKAFDLLVGGKTYAVTLDEAKSLDRAQKLSASEATSNNIDMVTVGANSIEKNGKQAVQLIASFKNKDMKLSRFGQPVDTTVKNVVENVGNGIEATGTGSRTEDIYATDKSGTKYKLEVPADAKAAPVTTFETGASKDSQLTINLPALLATYQKSVDNFRVDIPKDGETILNHEVDLIAQKAVAKSIKRLSPKSAELVFQLNTGDEKYVGIRSFQVHDKDMKKISSEFSGDTAVMTIEFDKAVDALDLEISWPSFVMNGNWTINMK
ncbi:MAG: hypothetical protein CVU90_11430 [Firmicutes bacterium HGW-Firmicutes-15]|nr:MAG: hypothetical protein CVU90_11430 [Firmicutes bacterium HGW-Firmicutes-15]